MECFVFCFLGVRESRRFLAPTHDNQQMLGFLCLFKKVMQSSA